MNLHLDWCDYRAAKYAVEHWHYSHTMPASKRLLIGVWEDKIFKGVIIFTSGAGAAANGQQYGLRQNFDMVELQRIALTTHESTVSRMVSIAIRILKQKCPRLRMIVSYSDPREGHHGGIYQAGNWVYVDTTSSVTEYELSNGRWVHKRTISKQWGRYELAHSLVTGSQTCVSS